MTVDEAAASPCRRWAWWGLLLLIRFDAARFGAAGVRPRGPDMDTTGALVVRATWPIAGRSRSPAVLGLPSCPAAVADPGEWRSRRFDTARTARPRRIAIAGLGVGLALLAGVADAEGSCAADDRSPDAFWPRAAAQTRSPGRRCGTRSSSRGILPGDPAAHGRCRSGRAFMIQLLTYGLASAAGGVGRDAAAPRWGAGARGGERVARAGDGGDRGAAGRARRGSVRARS